MPPAKDVAAWKSSIEGAIWKDPDSIMRRLVVLETEAKASQRFRTVYAPLIVGVVLPCVLFILQLLFDLLRDGPLN